MFPLGKEKACLLKALHCMSVLQVLFGQAQKPYRRGRKRMNTKEIQQREADREKVISDVLHQYVSLNGCPCSWPQFVFWAGKDQGPGWQDNTQNSLVKSALKLACFAKSPPKNPQYALEADVTCTSCGAQWKHFSVEWRMLAFQERLVRTDGHDADSSMYQGIIGEGVFATAGHEPEEGTRVLSLDGWVLFMKNAPFSTQPYRHYFRKKLH